MLGVFSPCDTNCYLVKMRKKLGQKMESTNLYHLKLRHTFTPFSIPSITSWFIEVQERAGTVGRTGFSPEGRNNSIRETSRGHHKENYWETIVYLRRWTLDEKTSGGQNIMLFVKAMVKETNNLA